MNKIYKDDYFKLNQYPLREDGDIFQTILDAREGEIDSQRFFLEYLPQEIAKEYDFNDLESLKKFRKICLTWKSPLQEMGGCNLREDELQKGIRYYGIKMSDPSGKVLGTFNINNRKIIYSPIFPHFYDERDNIKFANDKYFTTMTFEEIMEKIIYLTNEFYVHTGNYTISNEFVNYGDYILEKISKDQMLEFIYQPESGKKVFKKYLS